MERIHLLGDFSVETTPEYSQAAGLVRVAKRFYIAPPKKLLSTCDATSNGYPFYPGPIEYTANVKIPADMLNAEQILLKIGRFNGCAAAVLLNGQHAGYIARDPYTLVLPKEALIANGDNEIRFRLSGTFRNMFGPSHVADLDPANCGKAMWIRDFDFTDYTEYDIGILTNSFLLTPYGIGEISLEFYGVGV
jgi:hypothetical protein